jgi:hypothetical protein
MTRSDRISFILPHVAAAIEGNILFILGNGTLKLQRLVMLGISFEMLAILTQLF